MRTLKLTTPYMKGPDVKDAQKALKAAGYYSDKIDGQYGPITSHAASAAKWALGYPEKDVNGACGPTLMNYLTGKAKPGILMRRRINARKSMGMLGERAINVAAKFEGVSEQPPGSNQVMFANWYGIIGPWCAMFVTYCMVEAGSKAFERANRWSYCPDIYYNAKNHMNGLCIVDKTQMRAGDVVLFDWNLDGTADHVGMTTSSLNGGTFTTIEGNTSGSNPSDGGMVARNTHDLSNVQAFIRVLY